jgi:hypothetical protein
VKTGKRAARVGRVVAKMKNLTARKRMIATVGKRRIDGSGIQAASNAAGLPPFRVARSPVPFKKTCIHKWVLMYITPWPRTRRVQWQIPIIYFILFSLNFTSILYVSFT